MAGDALAESGEITESASGYVELVEDDAASPHATMHAARHTFAAPRDHAVVMVRFKGDPFSVKRRTVARLLNGLPVDDDRSDERCCHPIG
jgi:hypothetical protein